MTDAERAKFWAGLDIPGLDTDSGPVGTMEPVPGITIDELLGDGRHDEPDTGR